MTTARAIITQALQKIGVLASGETATGNDANDCLIALNTLVDSFPLDDFKQFTTQEVIATLPPGVTTRTIGPGMQVDTPRPVRVMGGAFCRSGGIDYPLDVITREQYAAISDKDASAHAPTQVYYDADAPTGLLYFYPTPAGSLELHLPVQQHLSEFTSLTADYSLPSGYRRFLVYALAVEVAPAFEREAPPQVQRTYQGLLRSLKRVNFSVPILDMQDTERRFNVISNTYS